MPSIKTEDALFMAGYWNSITQAPQFDGNVVNDENPVGILRKFRHETLEKPVETPAWKYEGVIDPFLTNFDIWDFVSFPNVRIIERNG